ncbi:MAG: vWA domain-containing protein [Actinomycetota bacterium]
MADARRRSTSRRELARRPDFEQMSPEVGELDEEAVEQALSGDPDETLSTLAELTGATDPVLRDLARRLAGRLFLDLARRGPPRPRGVGRLHTERFGPDGGDLDLDASLDAIVHARGTRSAIDPDELFVRTWTTPDTAYCLVVDRSGSMGGRPLATSALAAAAIACRAPEDYSVLSFGKDVIAPKSQDVPRSTEAVVDAVLALRGFGTTDVAGALHAAREQLSRSPASRRITVLLSDCRSTEVGPAGDPVDVARRLDELVIVAPDGEDDEAREFAAAVGARIGTVAGPSDIVNALTDVLDT